MFFSSNNSVLILNIGRAEAVDKAAHNVRILFYTNIYIDVNTQVSGSGRLRRTEKWRIIKMPDGKSFGKGETQ